METSVSKFYYTVLDYVALKLWNLPLKTSFVFTDFTLKQDEFLSRKYLMVKSFSRKLHILYDAVNSHK